jgi:hypothetical protein
MFAALASGQPPAVSFTDGPEVHDRILEEIGRRAPRKLRQVGTSSITLRLDLGASEHDAAFKPRTHTHPRGYLAEIAAYRLSRALGMDNVPPAIGRTMPRAMMEERFETERPEEWEPIREEILWDLPGVARGAAIYWVPRMQPSPLHTAGGLETASPWLAIDGEIEEGREAIARDLSTMLAFDYLIGNWDRFSGGNVSMDAEGRRLLVRDHNLAFTEPIDGERYTRIRTNLERVQRFSRGFVTHLMALDEAAIADTLAADPEAAGRSILSPAQIAGILTRRRALLSYVGALIDVHGADRVLLWP